MSTSSKVDRQVPKHLGPVHEAADRVGVSTMTIRRRIADGTLTGYRFGPRIIRVDLDEVEALLRPIHGGDAA